MKKVLFFISLSCSLTLLSSASYALDSAPTPYSAYDGVAPGARAGALGGAFSAIADDPSTVYYNPAGLSEMDKSYVAVTYEATRQSELTTEQIFAQESLRARNIQYIGFVVAKGAFTWRPLSNSTWRVESGADWQQNEIKINAYTLSAANKQEEKFSTGLNITYLSGLIAQSKVVSGVPATNISDGYGVAMDFGMLYTPVEQARVGIVFKNLAGFMWWDDFEKDILPFIFTMGFDFQIKKFTNFTTEWEKRYYRNADERNITRFGIEQWLGNILSARVGMAGTDLNDREKSSVSGGIGYNTNGFELDLTAEKYRVDKTDVYRYLISVNIPI